DQGTRAARRAPLQRRLCHARDAHRDEPARTRRRDTLVHTGAPPPEQLWRRAQAALAHNDAHSAYASLLILVRQAPSHVHAHLLPGGIAHAEGRLRDATRHALDAAKHVGANAAQIASVVNALLLVGEVVAARSLLAHPALAGSRDGPLLAHLAGA